MAVAFGIISSQNNIQVFFEYHWSSLNRLVGRGPFCFLRLLVHAMVAAEEGTEGTPALLKAITV